MTLSQLKQAIEAVPVMPQPEQYPSGNGYWDAMHDYQDLKFEAAMAAFEWRDILGGDVNRNCPCRSCREACAVYDEGMRLIREKLR